MEIWIRAILAVLMFKYVHIATISYYFVYFVIVYNVDWPLTSHDNRNNAELFSERFLEILEDMVAFDVISCGWLQFLKIFDLILPTFILIVLHPDQFSDLFINI